MLGTIKEFASARLDARPGFAEAVRERHALYFTRLASEADAEAVVADIDNLRVAWHRAVERRNYARLDALREGLWPVYEARGWYHETIQLADDLLALQTLAPEDPDGWQQRLSLLTSRAKALTLLRGYSAEAEAAFGEALALVKEHGEVPQP